ncbi:tRNA (adenosine(37)-N6)-threonylcarbamoyltransferase complex dimerization subunit type 1 TsaB [Nocardioides mesophilus]|uniref:tRNA (Adenosine(37)-N6)-threonylcarbamoyltransferase complex dimerization subunit type 1 TsaB n=1 Tax=Nocardioides mesophilus TaxID=433659 RepID=A0A7G9R781_9ACTN|nr:tRNA (adenosine(37)-N6)-threonylcarbamoyltransferase complex dimerization subunit type 1 TsaB [Nocardioides mesophilus]QNN51456.1 tRNA (adenosine(37)-N6)-threonylcarbamoyltransferase complex dimerization subunit type 1 TsaB [Nocardioides mesophilus]
MLLAFDTATEAVTVALHDGERVVAASTTVDARRHGELLAPAIAAVLDRAGIVRQDLTALAVGVGPGPFTGLRVGLVTARTLALVLDVPVYGVCTLDVLAAQALDEGATGGEPFLVATDARRKEVYWAGYDAAGVRLQGPQVSKPAEVATEAFVVGRGALLYPDAFPRPVGPEHPDAGVLAAVVAGERAELLDPEPLYLRRPDAAAAHRPKRVS